MQHFILILKSLICAEWSQYITAWTICYVPTTAQKLNITKFYLSTISIYKKDRTETTTSIHLKLNRNYKPFKGSHHHLSSSGTACISQCMWTNFITMETNLISIHVCQLSFRPALETQAMQHRLNPLELKGWYHKKDQTVIYDDPLW